MDKESIKLIQKSILQEMFKGRLMTEEYKGVLLPEMFGEYKEIANFFLNTPTKELSKDGQITSDAIYSIGKNGLNSDMIEIMTSMVVCGDVFRDMKTLVVWYFTNTKDNMFEKVRKTQECVSELEKIYNKNSDNENKLCNLYDLFVNEAMKADEKGEGLMGYTTGLPTLDKYTDGLQKGMITRLVAYSNIGKSKVSYFVCNHLMRQNAKILYFTLEVTQHKVLLNLLASFYNKTTREVNSLRMIGDHDLGEFFEKDLEIIQSIRNLDEIILTAKRKKPDVVFIDFVQNITTTKGGDEYQQMTEVAQRLQELAIEENIAFFDLSQTSQEFANRYIPGGKIPAKGSGALVHSADFVYVMERDTTTGHNLLHIAKNKEGLNNVCIELEMDFKRNQIKDLGLSLTENSETVLKLLKSD